MPLFSPDAEQMEAIVLTAEQMSRLSALEQRWDGPIPQSLRDAALGINRELINAEVSRDFYRKHVTGQLRIIRERRANGTFYPELLNDLRLYLERYRYWRGEVWRTAADLTEQVET